MIRPRPAQYHSPRQIEVKFYPTEAQRALLEAIEAQPDGKARVHTGHCGLRVTGPYLCPDRRLRGTILCHAMPDRWCGFRLWTEQEGEFTRITDRGRAVLAWCRERDREYDY
jgi:hypothetical protein